MGSLFCSISITFQSFLSISLKPHKILLIVIVTPLAYSSCDVEQILSTEENRSYLQQNYSKSKWQDCIYFFIYIKAMWLLILDISLIIQFIKYIILFTFLCSQRKKYRSFGFFISGRTKWTIAHNFSFVGRSFPREKQPRECIMSYC